MTVVFWSTPEPMWLFLTPQHDGFLCNGGLKGQAHSTEVSCLALHVLWFLWIPWIFSQYYVWYLGKDLNLCNFALRNVIFDLFDISLVKFSTKWWAMIQLCLQRLRFSFYTQTWYLELLPIHLLILATFTQQQHTVVNPVFESLKRLCSHTVWLLWGVRTAFCNRVNIQDHILGTHTLCERNRTGQLVVCHIIHTAQMHVYHVLCVFGNLQWQRNELRVIWKF